MQTWNCRMSMYATLEYLTHVVPPRDAKNIYEYTVEHENKYWLIGIGQNTFVMFEATLTCSYFQYKD